MKRAALRITGKVQGVFFRDSAAKLARQLKLAGFARNEPDGSVYIEVEGKPEGIERFLDWCRLGPPMAEVEKIETSEAKLRGEGQFLIRH